MHNILFSGGYDSTYLLQRVMRENNNIDAETVNIIMIESTFSGHKTDREIETRKKIINYLKAKYYFCKIKQQTIKIDTADIQFNRSPGLCQPLFWLPALLMCIPEEGKQIIQFSYILGDQAPIYHENIKAIIQNAVALNETNRDEKTQLEIKFPLIMKDKQEILADLLEDDEWLFHNCTCCESSWDDDDNCGKCTPCTHLKQALVNIVVNEGNDFKLRQTCKEELYNRFKLDLPFAIYKEKKETMIQLNNEEKYVEKDDCNIVG